MTLTRLLESGQRRRSFPINEKVDLVCHLFHRFGRYQFEQPSHLLADRVMLLFGENNPGVVSALGEKLRVQAAVVSNIETVERPSLRCCPEKVLFILTLAHSGGPGADDVNASQSKRLDQIAVLRVFIKINSDFHDQ